VSESFAFAVDAQGRTIWIADAHLGDGERFVVRADELLTAFVELEVATRTCGESSSPAAEIFRRLAVN
jgi:hypothetical protein